jgi:hypothetical protein
MAQDHGTLYHLVPVATWSECKTSGQPYFPSTYEQVQDLLCGPHRPSALPRAPAPPSRPSTHIEHPHHHHPPLYVPRAQDGFIHLTKEPSLLLTVANHFYRDVPGDWVVLCIDSSKLTSKAGAAAAAASGCPRLLASCLACQLSPCRKAWHRSPWVSRAPGSAPRTLHRPEPGAAEAGHGAGAVPLLPSARAGRRTTKPPPRPLPRRSCLSRRRLWGTRARQG